MIKWIEATGKNEEAAIASALAQLGLDRDDVSVEVLERAKKGLLGFGSAPARVRVSYEAPDLQPKGQPKAPAQPVTPPVERPVETPTEKPVEKPMEKPAPPVETEKAPEKKKVPAPKVEKPRQISQPKEESQPKEPAVTQADEAEVETRIRDFLEGLMTHMGVNAHPTIQRKPEGGFLVVMEGEKLGTLIGHRGETLDAIQQLTNYAVNRGRARRVRVHIDVENYRAKREEALRRLAEKVAAKVVKYRRNVTLEPMNAYERHVIHEALQEYPDVVTYSTGTEPNRRTVVAFSRGKHTY